MTSLPPQSRPFYDVLWKILHSRCLDVIGSPPKTMHPRGIEDRPTQGPSFSHAGGSL